MRNNVSPAAAAPRSERRSNQHCIFQFIPSPMLLTFCSQRQDDVDEPTFVGTLKRYDLPSPSLDPTCGPPEYTNLECSAVLQPSSPAICCLRKFVSLQSRAGRNLQSTIQTKLLFLFLQLLAVGLFRISWKGVANPVLKLI